MQTLHLYIKLRLIEEPQFRALIYHFTTLLKIIMIPKEKNKNKEIAFAGLGIGLFNLIAGLSNFDDEAGYLLFVFGVVFTLSGGGYLIYFKRKSNKLQIEVLNRIFYNLLQQNSGKISLVQFASASNLPANEARKFLEEKASEFGTVVDVDYDGIITYTFK